jgi:hypothetical protein
MVKRKKITTKELLALRKLRGERGGGGGWIAIISNKIVQNFELRDNKKIQRFQL